MVMRINVSHEGHVSVISLAGEEDTRSEETFNAAFRECFDRGCPNIILDLSKLKYLGSRLRKVLLANAKEALASGGKIKLLSPQPAVRLYLKDNRLLDFFEVYNIRQAVLDSFAVPSAKESEEEVPRPPEAVDSEASALGGLDERLDRLENSLIQLVEILRRRGVITEDEENQVFE